MEKYWAPPCWFAKRETLDALPVNMRKIICVPCESFESKLLFESRLSPESAEYALLKKVLFERLSFDERSAAGKLHAVVAGSYPAFLGKAMKQHNDVDVFIMANNSDLILDLLRLLQPDPESPYQYRELNGDIVSYGDIISVKNFGKIQLIIKHHFFECLCDFHLNARFFSDFHHCTRWRLDVFKNFFLVRYMPLERGRDRDVICLKTAITLKRPRKFSVMTKVINKLYPNKHINNVLDFGPPKLSQQALHVILKK